MRFVGLGRELVDSRRIDGVLPLLRALTVTVFPASRTEEIALQPLAVRAAPATAIGDKMSTPSAATGGASFQTRLARLGRFPVLLADGWFSAAPLATGRPVPREAVGVNDIGWKGAAQLGEHVIEIHGGLRLRRGVRRCPAGDTRAQDGHLAPARPERQRRTGTG